MKYFEKISFTKEQNKGLLKGIASGVAISTGLTGIELVRRHPYNPSFKKFMAIAKEKKYSILPILGGSALLGSVIAKQKREKKEKQALRNIVDAHPNLDISFKSK